jgi:hypothetical protein
MYDVLKKQEVVRDVKSGKGWDEEGEGRRIWRGRGMQQGRIGDELILRRKNLRPSHGRKSDERDQGDATMLWREPVDRPRAAW